MSGFWWEPSSGLEVAISCFYIRQKKDPASSLDSAYKNTTPIHEGSILINYGLTFKHYHIGIRVSTHESWQGHKYAVHYRFFQIVILSICFSCCFLVINVRGLCSNDFFHIPDIGKLWLFFFSFFFFWTILMFVVTDLCKEATYDLVEFSIIFSFKCIWFCCYVSWLFHFFICLMCNLLSFCFP